jgi:hypothetical protein
VTGGAKLSLAKAADWVRLGLLKRAKALADPK